MPEFQFTAIGPTGEMTNGVMEAPDAQTVIDQLKRRGNIPVSAGPLRTTSFLDGLLRLQFGRRDALSRMDVANMTRELAIMLSAGQDLDRALRFLVDTAPNPRVTAVLTDMRDAVRDGSPLATALARHPRSFSRLYIGLVRAGEAGGQLAATLERLAVLLEKQNRLSSTIKSSMIYPALLVVAAVGSITFLLTSVLPQFVPLFAQNGAALPTATRILIGLGDAISAYGLYALILLALAGLAVRQAIQRPAMRFKLDRLILRLPIVGALSQEVMAARFTRTLGSLLINGVALISALGVVREVVGNTAGVAALEQATRSAKSGAGLWRPIGDSGVFPTRTVYLLRLGEETAQLGPMCLRAADIHEEKAQLGIQRLVALLVPAIIIVMGGAVAFIVSSLMLAMLSLNDLAN
jgi:general secretion pathway protein F